MAILLQNRGRNTLQQRNREEGHAVLTGYVPGLEQELVALSNELCDHGELAARIHVGRIQDARKREDLQVYLRIMLALQNVRPPGHMNKPPDAQT